MSIKRKCQTYETHLRLAKLDGLLNTLDSVK